MAAAAEQLPLVDVEDRPYQREIARACLGRNSLIVLPTGLGKTLICARVMAHHIERGERVLVLAPTRPLVEQHAQTFRQHLVGADVTVLTGRTSPDDRAEAWTNSNVVVATPQVARNDLLRDVLDPADWGLLVVDEAHRAVGNYAAVPVAEAFAKGRVRVLGATASPGSSAEQVQEVCHALAIEHVEARGPWDEDVKPYVERVRQDWVRVTLPKTLSQAAQRLRKVAESEAGSLRSMGLYSSRFTSRRELLKVQSTLKKRLDDHSGARASRARSHVSRALRVLHAVQLVQTQSVAAARAYLDRMVEEDEVLGKHQGVRQARGLLAGYMGEHPKMRRCASELRQHLRENPEGRALVFTQFRDTASELVKALSPLEGIRPQLFIGQGGSRGLTQSEQVETLEEFRQGEHNVLVATSVGEEGLDVPSVGLVVFYDPVSSPVRQVQRRGRTGRTESGRVVLLMARNTPDEATYWSAATRERKMQTLVQALQRQNESRPEPRIRPNPSSTSTRDDQDDALRVLVDHRELNGPLARLLRQRGLKLDPQTLPVGDVILSNRLAVERKTASDFARSVIDGRLMDQARALKRSFDAPVFVVEGDPFEERGRIQAASIAGAISALSSRFGISVLTVGNVQQAADVVAAMARQEHKEETGPPKLRHDSSGRTPEERQRYLIEGLPQVSAKLAQRLLDQFGSPASVFAASEDELKRVHGIGPTTARAIQEALHGTGDASCETSTSTPAPARATASGTGNAR